MGTPNTGQIVVGTSATPIVSNPGGCLTVINLSAVDVYLGGTGVSTSTGILLPGTKGATLKLETCDDWYGIVAAGSARLAFIVGTPTGLFFLGGGGGGATIKKQVTILTPGQIVLLTTNFIPITETPPAGFRIAPLFMSLEYQFATTDYGATGTFSFFWGVTPSANFAYRVLNSTNFINGALANRYAICMGVSTQDSGVPQTPGVVDGLPVFVGNAAAAFGGGGDGNVILTAYYTIEADV